MPKLFLVVQKCIYLLSPLKNIKSCLRLVRQGRLSDALKALGSIGMHPDNTATFKALSSKHPFPLP
jgi:hypothetical protein